MKTNVQANTHQLPTRQPTMNSLRLARTALRARPTAARVPLQRRTYAEAVSDKVSTDDLRGSRAGLFVANAGRI